MKDELNRNSISKPQALPEEYKPVANTLSKLITSYGSSILAERRLNGMLMDMMPMAEKRLLNVLKKAVEDQLGEKLLQIENDEHSLRTIKTSNIKESFKHNNAFDDTALFIVDCFTEALGWNKPEPPIILPFKPIKIGNQIWSDRNLDVSHFRNGDPIPEARTDEEWIEAGENEQPAWCYYDNDPENGQIYGKLYNWYAVNDPRGLTPAGWHIATKSKWNRLMKFKNEIKTNGLTLKISGGLLEKESGGNETMFLKPMKGHRHFSGSFIKNDENYGRWWTPTHDGFTLSAWFFCIFFTHKTAYPYDYQTKYFGYPVRCVRNALNSELINSFIEIKIGNQNWADRNLDVSIFRNGDPIPEAKTDEEWQLASKNKTSAWCYYNNDYEIGKNYGKLYNWYAINDPRGLTPYGWRVPTNKEWEILIEFSGGLDIAGNILKSQLGWADDGNGSDEFNFTAIPGGGREISGKFAGNGKFATFWTESAVNDLKSLLWGIDFRHRHIKSLNGLQGIGTAVRCIRNKSDSKIDLPFKQVIIGLQSWSDRNLNVSHFRNGDPIPEASTAEEWQKAGENEQPAWCYYDNDPAVGVIYGKLYNWFAVNDPRGLAPEGWHIPNQEEWDILIDYLGVDYEMAGNKLKSIKGWEKDSNGTDEMMFSALPSGYRSGYGSWDNYCDAQWWSSTENSFDTAWFRRICQVWPSRDKNGKGAGLSVRCIKKDAKSEIFLQFNETKIGNQIWSNCNLDVCHFSNGEPIPEARTYDEWRKANENGQPAWCYYNNNPEIGKTKGKLYNWYAVNDPRGLAPKGWAVPSDEDWLILIDFLGGEKAAIPKLKSRKGWETNGNGIDEVGFNGLPGGMCLYTGKFIDVKSEGTWWGLRSRYNYGEGTAFCAALSWSDRFEPDNKNKKHGFSVRCVQD